MATFFALVFLTTWACWFAAAVPAVPTALGPTAILTLGLLGTVAPSLIAISLVHRKSGAAGVRALLRPILHWRVAARWWVFAVGFGLSARLIAALLHRGFVGDWPLINTGAATLFLAGVLVSTPGQAGEEVGWRGYALPGLTERFGLRRASLLLGLLVGLWHLPLFLLAVPGSTNFGQSLPVAFAGGVALHVAFAWLYSQSGGSLLLTMVMHAAVNQAVSVVPTRLVEPGSMWAIDPKPVTWSLIGLLWLAAAYFLSRMPGADRRVMSVQTPAV